VEALLTDFRRSLSQLIERRRESPADDLATILGDTTWDPEMDRARIGTGVLSMAAGHETTTNLIANTLRALFLHPEQLEQVRSDPAKLGGAIEETLRWDSPIQRVKRVVRQDTELSGVPLREGDRVTVILGSANRDPELCEQPEQFDVGRPPTAHLAFGNGMHFCLGKLACQDGGTYRRRRLP
jgi:cytochrome P450